MTATELEPDGPRSASAGPKRRLRGELRRRQVTEATAALVLEGGPSAVTHRSAAARAGASLSATTYYFDGLDGLLVAAGELLVSDRVANAHKVAGDLMRTVREENPDPGRALSDVVIPPGDTQAIRGFYEFLARLGGLPGGSDLVSRTRPSLVGVVSGVLAEVAPTAIVPPEVVIATIDGAVVQACAEGREPRTYAAQLTNRLLAVAV